jgi:hypothetical protein
MQRLFYMSGDVTLLFRGKRRGQTSYLDDWGGQKGQGTVAGGGGLQREHINQQAPPPGPRVP